MNLFKKYILLITALLSLNFAQPVLATDRNIINMQTYGLMGFGFSTSLVGLASIYSLLKAGSKETPFKKKDYLLVRALKATGSLALGATKVAAATALTVGGVALMICSPRIVEAYNN